MYEQTIVSIYLIPTITNLEQDNIISKFIDYEALESDRKVSHGIVDGSGCVCTRFHVEFMNCLKTSGPVKCVYMYCTVRKIRPMKRCVLSVGLGV